MWNLSGTDIEQAKEQLKGRRAAIKARYDDEMKRVDDQLAEIEKFERAAVEFMSNFKGEEDAPASVDEPELLTEDPSATAEDVPVSAHNPVEEHAEAPAAASAEASAEPTSSSRWRMRLNGGSATAAA